MIVPHGPQVTSMAHLTLPSKERQQHPMVTGSALKADPKARPTRRERGQRAQVSHPLPT